LLLSPTLSPTTDIESPGESSGIEPASDSEQREDSIRNRLTKPSRLKRNGRAAPADKNDDGG